MGMSPDRGMHMLLLAKLVFPINFSDTMLRLSREENWHNRNGGEEGWLYTYSFPRFDRAANRQSGI